MVERNSIRSEIYRVIKTTVDSQKRIVVPQAKPGQVYAIHNNLDGGFTLKAVEAEGPILPTCRLADEDGFPVVVPNQPIDEQVIKELLAEFP